MHALAKSIFLVSLALPAAAQGKKPEPKKSESSSLTLQDAKRGANDVLNAVDRGVHEAARDLKKGANKVLQSVDDSAHGKK